MKKDWRSYIWIEKRTIVNKRKVYSICWDATRRKVLLKVKANWICCLSSSNAKPPSRFSLCDVCRVFTVLVVQSGENARLD